MKLKPIEELWLKDEHHNNTSDILVKPKFAEFTRHPCLVNGFMFGRVMQNAEICKEFLERMLEINIDSKK